MHFDAAYSGPAGGLVAPSHLAPLHTIDHAGATRGKRPGSTPSSAQYIMVEHCEGCLQTFSSEGFRRHLALTKQPKCQRYGERIRHIVPTNLKLNRSPEPDLEDDPMLSADDENRSSGREDNEGFGNDVEDVHDLEARSDRSEDDPDVVPFEGDFFGVDYGPEDFGLMDEPLVDPSDNASRYDYEENGSQYSPSDEEDDVDEELEAPNDLDPPLPSSSSSSSSSNSGHEPPLPSPPSSPSLSPSQAPSSASSSSSHSSTADSDDHLAALAARNARLRVEKALRQPIHVEHFPVETAGAPLDDRDNAANTAYRANVPGSERNPYAPFASEIDWKLA
ncbi:hypothetical protein K474DRAFT_1710076, partial [Panus rudis PR-1116 ss-1]